METRADHKIDKSKWGAGPWQHEPDKLEWRYKGMPCLIVRGPSGALCGYAGVNPGHPWHGASYSDCVKGCSTVKPKPLAPIGYMPVPKFMQKRWMEAKHFSCKHQYELHHTPESIIDVHGGLTFSDKCQEAGAICHDPKPGEPVNVWWFGFDCAHGGDVSPKYAEYGLEVLDGKFGEVYRDVAYVRAEVEKLADQLLAV